MAIFQNLGPEGARIGVLAKRAKLANQSVGYLVVYLEEHGCVERRSDPANRRATLVCFTERGWDEADACAKILDQLDEELARGWARNGDPPGKPTWTMPPVETLPPLVRSPARTVALVIVRAYFLMAVLAVLVKIAGPIAMS